MLDMLGPGIDEGDVLARLHHMGAGIAADRTRSDNRYLPAHAVLPAFALAEASAAAGFITSGEPRRSLHSRYALRTTRNPMLLEALSGVFELRAATR